jgi:hypothetical protein
MNTNKNKKMLPYLIIAIASFYILPLLGKNTGYFILVLLVIFPLVSFNIGLIYGTKYGFNGLLPLLLGGVFSPTIFIYYNISAIIYFPTYQTLTLLGNFIRKKTKKNIKLNMEN